MVCDKRLCEEREEGGEGVSDGEASENYRTLQTLGFVKGLYRACYDNLCMVEKVRIPFSGYMKAEDIEKYDVMLEEVLYGLEGLGDMLEMMEERMEEKLDVWKEDE